MKHKYVYTNKEKGLVMDYKEFVATLIKPFEDKRLELAHTVMGICGEAGELCDAIKKHIIYGKELDMANVIEELGDLAFFITDLQNKLGITDQEILQGNADKLAERYKKLRYSDEAAIKREDKLTAGEVK